MFRLSFPPGGRTIAPGRCNDQRGTPILLVDANRSDQTQICSFLFPFPVELYHVPARSVGWETGGVCGSAVTGSGVQSVDGSFCWRGQ